jgi:hypothetical protein
VVSFVLLNLVLFAALIWASLDPLVIRVDLRGDTPVAEVHGVRLAAPEQSVRTDALTLYLDGPGRIPAHESWFGVLDEAAAPWFWLDTDQAWAALALFDDGQAIWSHDFADAGLAGWSDPNGDWNRGIFGDAISPRGAMLAHPDVELRGRDLLAVAQRGHNGVGVVVGTPSDGLFLLVRPLHRDLMWWRLHQGRWDGPLVGTFFLRPWDSALKDFLRHLLRPYFLALALATAFVLLGSLWSLVRRDRPLPPFSRRATIAILTWTALATFGMTAYIASSLLEHMPHVQDSVGYLFQAKVFALGRLWAPLPPLPDFFVHEFVVQQDGRWFAKYPPGFPALLSLGVLAGAPWLVNPIAASLAVVATALLGARTMGRGTGLLGGILLALSPFFMFLGGSHMAHTTGLLFAALFALFYVEADRGRRWAGVLAGVALGVDVLIRPWTAFCIAVPFAFDLLGRLRRSRRPTLVFVLLMALGFLPFLAAHVAYNHYFTGSFTKTTMELWWSFDRIGFGSDKGLGGHGPLGGLYNSLRNLGELSRHAFGWPAIATFAFAFVPLATGRAGRWERLWLASWFSLMLGYFFWWADGVMFGPRFYHEAMPFLVLLTARGVALLSEVGRLPGRVLAGPLLASLIAIDVAIYLPSQLPQLKGYNYVSSAALEAVERAGVRNAVVFTDPGPQNEWWNYGMVFSANSPLLDTDVIYARDRGPENKQLMDLYPGRRFYKLYRTVVTEISPEEGGG